MICTWIYNYIDKHKVFSVTWGIIMHDSREICSLLYLGFGGLIFLNLIIMLPDEVPQESTNNHQSLHPFILSMQIAMSMSEFNSSCLSSVGHISDHREKSKLSNGNFLDSS